MGLILYENYSEWMLHPIKECKMSLRSLWPEQSLLWISTTPPTQHLIIMTRLAVDRFKPWLTNRQCSWLWWELKLWVEAANLNLWLLGIESFRLWLGLDNNNIIALQRKSYRAQNRITFWCNAKQSFKILARLDLIYIITKW